MVPGGNTVRIEDEYDFVGTENRYKVISALRKEGTIDFYIKESDMPTTTYLFSVETSNFTELFRIL